MRITPMRDWTMRRRLITTIVTVVLLSGAAAAGVAYAHDDALPDGVALQVGHTRITKTQLKRRIAVLEALYGVEDPGGSKSATFRRDMAQAVAMSTVLDQAAKSRGVTVTQKAAQDTLASMITQQLGTSSADPQAAFTQLLGQFGVTENEVLDEVARQQSIGLLYTNVTAGVVKAVTDSTARAYYDKDPSRFATPESRTLRNIVVSSQDKAQQVLTVLQHGKPFAAEAKAVSLDQSTSSKGGSLGSVTPDQLDPAYAQVAFATTAGNLFGPVQTQYGWNVGLVEKITPAISHPYSEVSTDVLQEVRSQRAASEWTRWLKQQVKDAHVEYADTYRPAHPSALPSGFAQPSAVSSP